MGMRLSLAEELNGVFVKWVCGIKFLPDPYYTILIDTSSITEQEYTRSATPELALQKYNFNRIVPITMDKLTENDITIEMVKSGQPSQYIAGYYLDYPPKK